MYTAWSDGQQDEGAWWIVLDAFARNARSMAPLLDAEDVAMGGYGTPRLPILGFTARPAGCSDGLGAAPLRDRRCDAP